MALETLNERMDIKHLNVDYTSRRTRNPAAELFEELSKRTWLRLEQSLAFDISQGEETITDINLLDMAIAGVRGLKIWKCPKNEEPKLGIDWWWLIGNDHVGWRSYMVQAKKLDLMTKCYPTLNHRVGERTQIEILEEEAARRCAFPLFCFYNYVGVRPLALMRYMHCLAEPREVAQLGCTVAPLWLVQKIVHKRSRPTNRTFDYIHKQTDTIPWRCLVRCQHAAAAYRDPKNAPEGCDAATVYKMYTDIPSEVRGRFNAPGSAVDLSSPIANESFDSFPIKRIATIEIDHVEDPSSSAQEKHPLPEMRGF